jgi:tetratricopeptide (TPR) repeat protein
MKKLIQNLFRKFSGRIKMNRTKNSLLGLSLALLIICTSGMAYGGIFQGSPEIINIRNLFVNKQYDQLITIFNNYQKKCEADVLSEYTLLDAFRIFEENSVREEDLNNWVMTYNNSWVPFVARATYFQRLGADARGTKWAKDTTEKQIKDMRWYLYKANQDIESALKLNPKIIQAYVLALVVEKNTKEQKEIVERALNIYPGSYIIRRQYILNLRPRWGGSYAQMDSFAKESLPYSNLNPLIKTLPGFKYRDQANLAYFDRNLPLAIKLSKQALEYGENYNFRYDLADYYYRNKEYDKALFEIERAIVLRPNVIESYPLKDVILAAKKNKRW